jgi:hypothetical protein
MPQLGQWTGSIASLSARLRLSRARILALAAAPELFRKKALWPPPSTSLVMTYSKTHEQRTHLSRLVVEPEAVAVYDRQK